MTRIHYEFMKETYLPFGDTATLLMALRTAQYSIGSGAVLSLVCANADDVPKITGDTNAAESRAPAIFFNIQVS